MNEITIGHPCYYLFFSIPVIMEDPPLGEIEVKCEIIEISDEEVDLGPNSKSKKK